MLADTKAELTKALGLDLDLTDVLGSVRLGGTFSFFLL